MCSCQNIHTIQFQKKKFIVFTHNFINQTRLDMPMQNPLLSGEKVAHMLPNRSS
jgi:hypothetical protein